MKGQGFGPQTPRFKANQVVDAANLLLEASKKTGCPLVMPMHPPGNDLGLNPGEVMESTTNEIRPSCDGIVVAYFCTPEEVQEVVDLIKNWRLKKLGGYA